MDNTITGFLYVPDLEDGDPCVNLSQPYIPSNVTRQANLPPTDFTLVALAPWISAECTQAYLTGARLDPARAFLFYLVDNGTIDGSAQPPPISSPAWDLQDGGAWKSETPFPVYAVPSDIGAQLMYALSLYSGNMTQVPHGHDLSETGYDPRDYVRLYTQIDLNDNSSLPSIGVFMLIILGILALMLALTSATMHLIQRSRRNSLRRRIVNGEVDLEALGINRLTVPQEVIEKCPLFTYDCEDDELLPLSTTMGVDTHTNCVGQDNSNEGPQTTEATLDTCDLPLSSEHRSLTADEIPSTHSSLVHKYLPYSQPTCPICLEDFKSGITPIRELPCGHIFHPGCIDPFLGKNSSLCPMCKKSVLPSGYCPARITNSIVRRERNLRRLRSRVTINEEDGVENPASRFQNFGFDLRRIFLRSSTSRRIPETLSPIPLQPQPALMADATSLNSRTSILGNEPTEDQYQLSQLHSAQLRIQELSAGRSLIYANADVTNERGGSRCMYPALRSMLLADAFCSAERSKKSISWIFIITRPSDVCVCCVSALHRKGSGFGVVARLLWVSRDGKVYVW